MYISFFMQISLAYKTDATWNTSFHKFTFLGRNTVWNETVWSIQCVHVYFLDQPTEFVIFCISKNMFYYKEDSVPERYLRFRTLRYKVFARLGQTSTFFFHVWGEIGAGQSSSIKIDAITMCPRQMCYRTIVPGRCVPLYEPSLGRYVPWMN